MNKTLSRILGGLVLVGLLATGYVYAQPLFSNNLFALGGNAGVAPQLQAVGTDPNISINLVPKGTGTVQVNGTPITGAGSSLSLGSLTVTTGPTNLTGGLFLMPGASTVLEQAGAVVLSNSSTNVTTTLIATEQDLFNFSIPANTLSANNQFLVLDLWDRAAATANAKQTRVYFGATLIGDSTSIAVNASTYMVRCTIWRTGAATQKATCGAFLANTGAWNAAVGGGITAISTPAENTTGAITIRVTGTDAVAAGGTNLETVKLLWYPAGQ